ncbi:MAG: tetratricopeptide repeat protein [Candidatus Kapaibacteriales bacterium]
MNLRRKQTLVKSSSSTIWLIIGLFSIVLFSYYRVAYFDFVWDDNILYINRERLIHKFNLVEIFTPQKDRMYMPLTYVLWKLVGEFGKSNAMDYQSAYFHLFNLMLHLANSILAFFIIKKFLKDELLSFMGAIIFALHPIQVESVAWISEARGLLSASFGFIAILVNFYYLRENTKKYFPVILLFLILSILSKPSGIVFPLVLVVTNIMNSKTMSLLEIFKKNWIYFILLVPFAFIASLGESTKMIEFEAPIWLRPILFINSIGFYVYKIFLPFGFSPGYGLSPKFLLSHPQYLLFSIIGVLIIVAFIFLKDKIIRFSILVFVIGFLPVSNLITFYYQYWSTVADRYVYISVLGVGIFFPRLINQFLRLWKVPIIVLLGLLFAVLTEQEIKKWQNEFTLWTDCIEKYPDRTPHPYLGRGLAYQEKGKFNEALNDFTKCIELDSTYLFAYYNRGNVYLDLKRYDLALQDFTKAVQINSKYTNALVNRGITLMELSRFDEALNDFSLALSSDSNQVDALYYRGFCYLKLLKLDSALHDFERYYYFNPNDNEISKILQQLKRKNKGTSNEILN